MTPAGATTLDELVRYGAGGEHLAECPHARTTDFDSCDWCRWALLTPELASLVVVAQDTRTLLRSDVLDTIAGVVATARLLEIFGGIDIQSIRVPSARQLAATVLEDTATRLTQLRTRVNHTTRPGGPIDERCHHTAGALAVAALQIDADRHLIDQLPAVVRNGLDELTAELSGDIQLSSLLPVVEHLHWRGMPELTSQPEWARRPPPGGNEQVRPRQLAAAGVAPGSLEALVVESIIDRCTERLLELGSHLAEAFQPVWFWRDASCRPFDSRLRQTLWRILPFEWHLTLIDTGLADCWGAATRDGVREVVVPWTIDIAIRASLKRSHGSALFHDLPEIGACQ